MLIELPTELQIQDHSQQRAIADFVEGFIIDTYKQHFQHNFIPPSGKKSTDDFSIRYNNQTILIDVKTRNINSNFSMPNLISFAKLSEIIYNNIPLKYLFYHYEVINNKIVCIDYTLVDYFHLDLNNLQISSLGKGQVQIKDMNKPIINVNQTKDYFEKEIRKMYMDFCNKQIKKFQKLKEVYGI